MTSSGTRYVPVASIVRGETPSERSLDSSGQLGQFGIGINDGIESRLFAERQTGHFLVTPEDCVGMDRVYKLSDSPNSSNLIVTKQREGRVPPSQHTFNMISIPDPAIMAELELIDQNGFQRVKEFYDRFRALNTSPNGEVASIYIFLGRAGFSPRAEGSLAVYHNGARVNQSGYSTPLHHGDVVKVGPSLVFGYMNLTEPLREQVRKAQEQGSSSESSALSTVVERGVTKR